MFIRLIIRKLQVWMTRRKAASEDSPSCFSDVRLSKNLVDNLDRFRKAVGGSGDIKYHELVIEGCEKRRCMIIYVDGLVRTELIIDGIIRPMLSFSDTERRSISAMDGIREKVLCCSDVNETQEMSVLVAGCLAGDTILFCDGFDRGLAIDIKGWEKRAVTEPQTETVVRGPREGFTENFRTNTSLIRRRIKSPGLRMDHMVVGRRTLTQVCVVYMEGVSDPKVVETVKKRIKRLNIDSILDSGNLEEYIEDAPFSIFSTIGHTEKPDVAAAKLLEGRTAVIVEGSPFVLTMPMLFIENFQTAEDYYGRAYYSSMIRILRYISYFITVFAPSAYIALTTFHQELLPTTLLFTVAAAREGTPFPAFIEALIMVFSYEILREAGLRLPRPVGQAISIVGALIMGDAAVSAGLVGAPMVITIALTAVAGFVTPGQNESASLLRIIMMFLATFLGGYGIAMGFLGVLVHLASLRSFGVPFFEGMPLSPDLKDSYIRMPLWTMSGRPKDIAQDDMRRKDPFVPPDPPYREDTGNAPSKGDEV